MASCSASPSNLHAFERDDVGDPSLCVWCGVDARHAAQDDAAEIAHVNEQAAQAAFDWAHETAAPGDAPLAGPAFGTRAWEARLFVEIGAMSGDEADRWKDEQKDRDTGL